MYCVDVEIEHLLVTVSVECDVEIEHLLVSECAV